MAQRGLKARLKVLPSIASSQAHIGLFERKTTQLQSQGDILSHSGGNQLLQGTKVRYGGTATFTAGVGERARADARIILEGVKTEMFQQRTRESNYVVWQRQIVLKPTLSGVDASAPNGKPHADDRCAARAPGFFGLGCRR